MAIPIENLTTGLCGPREVEEDITCLWCHARILLGLLLVMGDATSGWSDDFFLSKCFGGQFARYVRPLRCRDVRSRKPSTSMCLVEWMAPERRQTGV